MSCRDAQQHTNLQRNSCGHLPTVPPYLAVGWSGAGRIGTCTGISASWQLGSSLNLSLALMCSPLDAPCCGGGDERSVGRLGWSVSVGLTAEGRLASASGTGSAPRLRRVGGGALCRRGAVDQTLVARFSRKRCQVSLGLLGNDGLRAGARGPWHGRVAMTTQRASTPTMRAIRGAVCLGVLVSGLCALAHSSLAVGRCNVRRQPTLGDAS